MSGLEASRLDHLVCLASPFHAIGEHYLDFAQVPDAEVARLLEEARAARP